MSNLIVYCDDDEQTRAVGSAILQIVELHPSRVVLLTAHGETGEPGIEAFVSGHYNVLPGGWQVCAEQIRVVADAQAGDRLPSVARSQIIGDLPTTLWWASRQPPPFTGKQFFQLAEMSDQIIYDSFGWTNPVKGMQAMSRWVAAQGSEYVIYNLAWRRLRHWRNLIGQVLDPAVQPGALRAVTALRIEHGPHAVAMAALLVGWLAAQLGWQTRGGKVVPGRQTVWQFQVDDRQVPVMLVRVAEARSAPVKLYWSWRDGDKERCAVLADLGDQRLGIVEAESDVAVRIVSAPEPAQGMLVAAQMAHRSRDRVFERALETGNSMTGALL